MQERYHRKPHSPDRHMLPFSPLLCVLLPKRATLKQASRTFNANFRLWLSAMEASDVAVSSNVPSSRFRFCRSMHALLWTRTPQWGFIGQAGVVPLSVNTPVGHTLALGVFWLNPEGQLLWAPARHVLPLDNSLGHRVACWRPRRIRLSITVQMAEVVVRLLSRVTVLDRQFEEDMRNVLCQRYYPWPGRLAFRWRNFGRRGSSSII